MMMWNARKYIMTTSSHQLCNSLLRRPQLILFHDSPLLRSYAKRITLPTSGSTTTTTTTSSSNNNSTPMSTIIEMPSLPHEFTTRTKINDKKPKSTTNSPTTSNHKTTTTIKPKTTNNNNTTTTTTTTTTKKNEKSSTLPSQQPIQVSLAEKMIAKRHRLHSYFNHDASTMSSTHHRASSSVPVAPPTVTKMEKKLLDVEKRNAWKQQQNQQQQQNQKVGNISSDFSFVKSSTHWKQLPIMPHIRNYIERIQGGKYYSSSSRNRVDRRMKNKVSAPKFKKISLKSSSPVSDDASGDAKLNSQNGATVLSKTSREVIALYDHIFDNKKVKFMASASKQESIPHPQYLLTGKPMTTTTTTLTTNGNTNVNANAAAVHHHAKYLPEVAFAGRSNVGKSSLLNALVNSGGKARVGNKPGLTQSINFFNVSGFMCFIDLPGYGFALAENEKSEYWNEFVKWFLYNRHNHTKTLKRVFVLIDSRHGLKASDYEFLQFLTVNKVQNQIVFTKNDLIPGGELAKKLYAMELAMKEDEVTFRYTMPQILLASSKSNSGVHDLQRILTSFIEPQKIAQTKAKLQLKRVQEQVLF